MRAPARDEGFALVETLGVLLVGALIVVTLALAVGLVVRSSGAVARQANAAEVMTSGLAAVRRDLSDVVALAAGTDPKAKVLFQGSPNAVGFATQDEVVWIAAATTRGTGALARSAHPALPGIGSLGSPEFGRAATLLSGPWAFRFSYASFEDAGAAWIGEWIGRNRLPDLIRLEVFGADRRGRLVASLVVSPKTRRDRRCIFDEPKSCLSEPMAAASP